MTCAVEVEDFPNYNTSSLLAVVEEEVAVLFVVHSASSTVVVGERPEPSVVRGVAKKSLVSWNPRGVGGCRGLAYARAAHRYNHRALSL